MLTLKECQDLAISRGGECLSKEYIGNNYMEWRCEKNHTWTAIFSNVKKGKWCPHCAGNAKLSLKECQDLAISKGGECLSKKYINAKTNMQWKCEKNHTWFATFSNVKNSNSWCPTCAIKNKLTLQECQELAISKGGKCLSTEYINTQTYMEWKCKEESHPSWLANFKSVKHGNTWCPTCAGKDKLTLEECQDLAISRGGKCLSTEYINTQTSMEWKCKEESHQSWFATFGSVKNANTWCLTCAGKNKLTLKECQFLAISRGGKCLSTEYINTHTYMEWKCKEDHTWFAIFNSVKDCCTWCPTCAGYAKLTLQECQELAISKGGKCLSTEYINTQTYMEWKCKEESHPSWLANFKSVKHGNTWCAVCAGNKLTLKECQDLAISKGGKCLSTEYINAHISMEWKCKEESHPSWLAIFKSVKHGNTWCPDCSKSRSEKLCREILEEYTGLSFTSIRPNWLKNSVSGNNLELDGFCEDLRLAFEYQGKQHYEYIHHFHRKEGDFERQQDRDKLKLDLCKKHDIDVLIIPHTLSYQNENELRIFIKEELIKRLNCEFLFLE